MISVAFILFISSIGGSARLDDGERAKLESRRCAYFESKRTHFRASTVKIDLILLSHEYITLFAAYDSYLFS